MIDKALINKALIGNALIGNALIDNALIDNTLTNKEKSWLCRCLFQEGLTITKRHSFLE